MSGRLTLLIWPGYVSPATLEDFAAESGVSVELEIVPSADEMVARMRGRPPAPDVLVPPDYAVRQLSAEGLLLPLDPALLPNLVHLEPHFRTGRAHDPEARLSLPKDWGTTGYLYRADRIAGSPASWADFWELAASPAHSGRVSLLDSPGEVIGAALKRRGRSYNDSSPEALGRARLDLLDLHPHLRCFATDYKPLLAGGEVDLALGWNGDAAALAAQGVPVRYVLPAEGSQIWEDDWAISADSRQPAQAHRFLDFMLRPEIAAREAEFTGYATPNREAKARLAPSLREDPAIYPPPEVMALLEPGLPHEGEAAARRQTLWEEVRRASRASEAASPGHP